MPKEVKLMKKIIYWVQRYKPHYEAVSKEVKILAEEFSRENKVTIFNLHLDGLFNFKNNSTNPKIVSSHFLYYPITLFFAKYLNHKADLSHIYTSLGDRPYLPILKKRPILLTAAAPCSENKIKSRIKYLKKVDKIVVESDFDLNLLLKYGIKREKIELVYPPVNLDYFKPIKNKDDSKQKSFKILYASSPEKERDFRIKGFYLLVEAARINSNFNFDFPWRYKSYESAKNFINQRRIKNINIYHSIEKNMNQKYSEIDCTIIPYTKRAAFVKQMPNSAIESLAAGKPVLISSRVDMAELIRRERCGVVFEPDPKSLAKAIREIKRNYDKYQRNCRKTAERYFGQDRFIKRYGEIYFGAMK